MSDKKKDNIITLKSLKNCKDCNDKTVDSFIDTIEEEIRNENWQRFWDKYGKFITYVTCGVLGAVGIYSMWQKQDMQEREAISERFTEIQMEIMSGNSDFALAKIKEVSNVSKKEYAILARFEHAAVLLHKKDKQALNDFLAIANDPKCPEIFKGIAYIYYVNAALDLMINSELLQHIPEFRKNLQGKYIGKAWDLMAKESLAYCYIKEGEHGQARDVLQNLSKTQGIPEAMAERVRILNHALGG